MQESTAPLTGLSPQAILLAMTVVTGIVDAVSILALGHVFTANMTGNVVFIGFGLAGAPGMSLERSVLALASFLTGALIGGGMTPRNLRVGAMRAAIVETVLLLAAATVAIGLTSPHEDHRLKVEIVIVITAIAMGLRNAVVRKLGVPDLTTTVLTMTITGLAADSALAGGDNPRWLTRCASILAMLGGAFAGAAMVRQSVSLPLFAGSSITALCAFAWFVVTKRSES